MIWIRRALQLLAGSLLAVILLLALVYVTFSEADYKRSLVWIAEHIFDSTLQIDGPLSLQLSRRLVFNANDVTLAAHDDSFSYSSQSLSVAIQLGHLLSGTLWIDNIELSQLHLRVNETAGPDKDWHDMQLPPVIVARADINQLEIEYQELPPGTLHHIDLESLHLDDVNNQGPVSITARGEFEGREFSLKGYLPAIADVLAGDRSLPLDLELTSKDGRISMKGSIEDPMDGEGLDLHLGVHTRNTTVILEWLGDDIPDLGVFSLNAHLLGSYDTPRLDAINASLSHDGNREVIVRGSVNDIYTGEGLDLVVESQSQRPVLVSWLITDKPDQLASIDLKGRLQEQDGRFLLTGVDASIDSHDGLVVTLAGDAELYPPDHALVSSDNGLRVSFNMPSLSALNILDVNTLPATGATSGQFRLLVSLDAVAVYDADLRIRSREVDSLRVRGRIGRIPFQDQFYASDIDLQVLLTTTSVKAFADQFDATLTDLGSGEAQMRITGSTDKLRLSQVSLQAGYASGLRITASGRVDQLILQDPLHTVDAQFKVTANAPDLEDLSAITDVEFPALGALSINGDLTVQQARWRLENLQVNVGRPDQPTIRLNGSVASQLNIGSTINVDYSVAVADMVAAFTDRVPGYLGRLKGSAEISDIDGSMGIERFGMQSTQTSLYKVSAHGAFDDLKNNDEVNISVDLEVPDPAALGRALDINLADMAAYSGTGKFTSSQDAINYHGVVNVGTTRGTTILQGSKNSGYPTFKGNLSIPVLDLKDFGFEAEQVAEYEVVAKPGPGSKDYLFSRRPLHFGFLNDFGLDMDIDIDQIESYGRYSIDKARGRVKLDNGDLHIDPLTLVYANGTMNMALGLQARQTPVLSLQARADDLLLGPAMAQVTEGEPVRGRTNVNVDVTAAGSSAHAMASTLNGTISVEYEYAKVPHWLIDFLSVDVFGWVFSSTLSQQQYYTLNCIVAEFEATDGQLNSKLLVADGQRLTVGGRVDLDLGEETIDAVLLPRQKERLFSSITPVTLTGPIKSPSVVAIPVKAAIQEIGALTLSAPIYLSARVLGSIWAALRTGRDVGVGCSEIDKMTDEAEAAAADKSK